MTDYKPDPPQTLIKRYRAGELGIEALTLGLRHNGWSVQKIKNLVERRTYTPTAAR